MTLNEKLLKMCSEGWSIGSVISPAKFGEGIHYYIPKKHLEKLGSKKLFILEKDGKTVFVTEDE
jgi:hypothetical protein